jgi:hypothetical protein
MEGIDEPQRDPSRGGRDAMPLGKRPCGRRAIRDGAASHGLSGEGRRWQGCPQHGRERRLVGCVYLSEGVRAQLPGRVLVCAYGCVKAAAARRRCGVAVGRGSACGVWRPLRG